MYYTYPDSLLPHRKRRVWRECESCGFVQSLGFRTGKPEDTPAGWSPGGVEPDVPGRERQHFLFGAGVEYTPADETFWFCSEDCREYFRC